ncbi:hypothetical protein NPIL_373941 [Nephila pilipes]|uniref:Uncharacterized protein n=1 Tax=Nephila pilipes TaxID=299642 RepID=A0A8X6NZG7_NEPPI|nr:hypothetical protein NPIL_373941 [Nephila pilipes]
MSELVRLPPQFSRILCFAWNSITPKGIENYSHHAGFSKLHAPQELMDIEADPTFREMFQKVSTPLDRHTTSFNEFVADDDDVHESL